MTNVEKKRIVVIEDNSAVRLGICTSLVQSGRYDLVAQYNTAEEAMSNIETDLPDVVLMDIELPGMSGIDCTLFLKKHFPSIIVLIITVYEDSEKVFQSLCAGADGYIVKNANVMDMTKNIDEALAGGAPMSLSIARMVVKSFQNQQQNPLSDREKEVLKSVASGKSYSKIADELFISKETVRTHIKNIYRKLEVNSKEEALGRAHSNNWLTK